MKRKQFIIPRAIARITETLEQAGFEAYLVGGCVRDLYRGVTPRDWDVTTSAHPEEIQRLFSHTFYENTYGTVGVVNEEISEDANDPMAALRVVEVTPYRKEEGYSDYRRPDKVHFHATLEDDLTRRDFTMNAIAYHVARGEIVDPFGGARDIERHLIRAVGNPQERFHEDALRVLRALRFGAELGFAIEKETMDGIVAYAHRLEHIAAERIRDELTKILLSDRPMEGIVLMHRTGVLKYVLPELEAGIGCAQNGDHIYDVWEHNLRALQHAAERRWPLHVRLAALLHDIAKPETRRWSDEKRDWTFYGHDVVGGKRAAQILERLRFPGDIVQKVATLVRYHLFFSDIDKITLSAVRRIVARVGPDLVWDLMDVRSCDRIGMGRPKEKPYRLRKYESMIEEALRAPVSVGMLNIDGSRVMEVTGERPGPRIGWILHALFNEVLDDPGKNAAEYLEQRARELAAEDPMFLEKLGRMGKEMKERKEEEEITEIRKKYGVK